MANTLEYWITRPVLVALERPQLGCNLDDMVAFLDHTRTLPTNSYR